MTLETELPPEARDLLRRCGGTARRKWLLASGISTHRLRQLAATGALVRHAYGWYSLPSAPPDSTFARRVGGSLTGPSALQMRGAWRAHDKRLHVRVDRRHRARYSRGTCIHRNTRLANATQVVIDNVAGAFLSSFECQPIDELVAIADSLLRERLIDYETLVDICMMAGRRGRRVLELCDVGSESGLESLVRVRLRSLRIKLKSQWRVPGARRYDLRVGRSFLIETDGREHHDLPDAFHRDRDADQIAISRGYRVMRLTYQHVVHEWPATLERILAVVRNRWHLKATLDCGS